MRLRLFFPDPAAGVRPLELEAAPGVPPAGRLAFGPCAAPAPLRRAGPLRPLPAALSSRGPTPAARRKRRIYAGGTGRRLAARLPSHSTGGRGRSGTGTAGRILRPRRAGAAPKSSHIEPDGVARGSFGTSAFAAAAPGFSCAGSKQLRLAHRSTRSRIWSWPWTWALPRCTGRPWIQGQDGGAGAWA